MWKHRRDLERARQPHARDRRGRITGDVATIEGDTARRRRQEVSQKVEAGRLASPMWSDQRVNCMTLDLQTDVLDCNEPLELLRKPAGLEDYFLFRHALPRGSATKSKVRAAVQRWRRYEAEAKFRASAAKTAFGGNESMKFVNVARLAGALTAGIGFAVIGASVFTPA